MLNKIFGKKSLVVGVPVVAVTAVALYTVTILAGGFKVGLIAGTGALVTFAIISLFGALLYNFLTKAREELLGGYFTFLSFLIIANIVTLLYMTYVEPLIGFPLVG